MGYGVVIIPLSADAPSDLRIFGKDFTPGMWKNRGVGPIDSTIEIMQETLPSALGTVLSEKYRSHIDLQITYPLNSHEMIGIERILFDDALKLDLLILHIELTNEALNVFGILSELRKEGLSVIEKCLDVHPGFIAKKRRAICVIESEDQDFDGRTITFSTAGLDGDRDVRTWGAEAAILASIQHYAAQEVTSRLPTDVSDYTNTVNLKLLQLFSDKYWVPKFIVKESAQNLVEIVRRKCATQLMASNLVDIYKTNLYYANTKYINRINYVLIGIGILGLALPLILIGLSK
jgi:hypothetical protein